jgi:hypothetical protein
MSALSPGAAVAAGLQLISATDAPASDVSVSVAVDDAALLISTSTVVVDEKFVPLGGVGGETNDGV